MNTVGILGLGNIGRAVAAYLGVDGLAAGARPGLAAIDMGPSP